MSSDSSSPLFVKQARLEVQPPSTNLLKLWRYLSTRFEMAPPKLEVSLKLTHVLLLGRDAKETTPAAKWSGAWPLETVRQASLRSGTRSTISSVASCCFPLNASDAEKCFSSDFRTRFIAVMNLG